MPQPWDGGAGHISWALPSPDFPPCGYNVWAQFKDMVNRKPPSTGSELNSEMEQAVACVDKDTLQKVYENIESRFCFVLSERMVISSIF